MRKDAATVRGILFPLLRFTAIVFISFGLLVTGVLLWAPSMPGGSWRHWPDCIGEEICTQGERSLMLHVAALIYCNVDQARLLQNARLLAPRGTAGQTAAPLLIE